MDTSKVSNGFNQHQDQRLVGPDLGPNFLQRLSSTNKERNSNIDMTINCEYFHACCCFIFGITFKELCC